MGDRNPELKGNNIEGRDTHGIFIKMSFDPQMAAYLAEDVITVPFELYKIEWSSFGWKHLTQVLARIISDLSQST